MWSKNIIRKNTQLCKISANQGTVQTTLTNGWYLIRTICCFLSGSYWGYVLKCLLRLKKRSRIFYGYMNKYLLRYFILFSLTNARFVFMQPYIVFVPCTAFPLLKVERFTLWHNIFWLIYRLTVFVCITKSRRFDSSTGNIYIHIQGHRDKETEVRLT